MAASFLRIQIFNQAAILVIACMGGMNPIDAFAEINIIEYRSQIWNEGPGADGNTYAIAIAAQPWSWREARAAAMHIGADLACTSDSNSLRFVMSLANGSGAFDCAGPWIGGYRFGGASWKWTNSVDFIPFAWDRDRPSQSLMLDAVTCLGGAEEPNGTLFDSLPSSDAGVTTRSAIFVWYGFIDCDRDGIPDQLQIAEHPVLDVNHDGVLDRCENASPADLDFSGKVDTGDIGICLLDVGQCSDVENCPSDLDGSGEVDTGDIGIILLSFD